MGKIKNLKIRDRIIALSLATTMLGAVSACDESQEHDDSIPYSINQELSNIDKYYKHIIEDDEYVKAYKSEYIFYFINKETYEVKELLMVDTEDTICFEVYDLNNNDEIVVYEDRLTFLNQAYYEYLVENSYQVSITNIGDFIENPEEKDYYSLKEIQKIGEELSSKFKKANPSNITTKKLTKTTTTTSNK